MRITQVLAVLFTAIYLIPGGAHLFEFRAKIGLPGDAYLAVQSLYAGWAFFGIAIFAALLLDGLAAFMLAGRPGFSWALAACLLLALSLGIFFTWTFPVNQITANWTKLPANWQDLRQQWEYSHMGNAAVTFASLVCATISIVLTRR